MILRKDAIQNDSDQPLRKMLNRVETESDV